MAPFLDQPSTTSELTAAGVSHTIQTTTTAAAPSPLAPLDASRLTTTFAKNPRPVPAPDSPEVASGALCTDHMILCSWDEKKGWAAPSLQPYGPLSIMPTASVLHYATECFEGMKMYRGYDGALRLFRPHRNAKRMLSSATRISLPGFEEEAFVELVAKLCAVDGPKWLPKERPGNQLYIRPTMISDDPALGVHAPRKALFYVILSSLPVPLKPAGLRLLASKNDEVRAWPGGFGYAKVGANYGPSLLAVSEAQRRGYTQILWLLGGTGDGSNAEVTEAGACNFFVVWRTLEGDIEMVTAPLDNQVILDGITRRSVIELANERLSSGWRGDDNNKGWEKIRVVERKIEMHEIVEAVDEGRIIEAFGSGTAYFVAPISTIHFQGRDLDMPLAEGTTGTYARLIKTWLSNIMYGKEKHEWAMVVNEEGVEA